MTPVIVESPYAGDVALHLRYLRACMRDCLLRGEAPYASHALYTQPGVLRDEIADERELGIVAGFAWRALATRTVFYEDLGWSGGMKRGLEACLLERRPHETRSLGPAWCEAQIAREKDGHAFSDWVLSLVGTPR